jgi:hypothetical protein
MNYSNASDSLCHIPKPNADFPDDLFSLEQRRNGAIILHILVAIYIIGMAKMSRIVFYLFFLFLFQYFNSNRYI